MAFIVAIAMRSPLAVDILRDRGVLYRVIDAEHVQNVYNFKLMNKGKATQNYKIEVSGIIGELGYDKTQSVAPGNLGNMAVTLTAKASNLKAAIQTVEFKITTQINGESISVEESSRFFSPQ
jgi:polyferredoxin